MAQAIADEYRTSLEDLTFNSKPHINALTMLSEEYQDHADVIVRVIEERLDKALRNCKLPIMYLMDSIVKNVGGNYKPLFAKNIVKSFMLPFQQGDDKIKMSLYKLRSTWDSYFPLKRLHELDVAVHSMDANWPVKPLPASLQEKATSIHVNPKFLKTDGVPATRGVRSKISSKPAVNVVSDSSDLKQDLINKQKQLLELQQQKLLLELEQTKQQLAMREKKTLDKKQVKGAGKDPRIKQAARAGAKATLVNGGETRDPRILLSSAKSKNDGSDPRKSASDLNRKPVDVKKSDVPKLAEKKVSVPNTDKNDKKKKSPSSVTKANSTKAVKSVQKVPKSDGQKKVPQKKSTGKAVKRNSPERKMEDMQKSIAKAELEKSKASKMNKDKRSPSRSRPPPAKQPRRSSSIERRRSPRRDMNASAERSRIRPIKNDEHRRFSPMSGEGSMSPRFSPEPEESPRRDNWGPARKRARHHNFPPHPNHQIRGIRRRTSVDPNLTIPQELTLSHQAEIMKQAGIQLQTGQLTHSQHQDLLKQLHQLFQLQRIRSSVGPEPGMQMMPLDELLPPQPPQSFPLHNEEFGQPHPIHFREDYSPPYRSSPPRMEENLHPPHSQREHNLTPPPIPPMDPRRSHDRPGDRRMGDYQDNRPRRHRDSGRRRSPPQRQPNIGWDANDPCHHNNIGTDMGNVYIMDDDEVDMSSKSSNNQDFNNSETMHDLHNGSRPSNRVPLRAYADGDASRKRRHSFESNSLTEDNLNNDAIEKPSIPPTKVDSDRDSDGPHLEEPEDYIIANIPPGAEAYHEHSMKLKRGNKVSATMIASRKLSDAGTSGNEQDVVTANAIEDQERLTLSPELSRDKLDDIDELSKSPSLPLKKRKYLLSPGGTNESEAAIDSPDVQQDQITEKSHQSETHTDEPMTLANESSKEKSRNDNSQKDSHMEEGVAIDIDEKIADDPPVVSSDVESKKIDQPVKRERASAENEKFPLRISETNNEPPKRVDLKKKDQKKKEKRDRKAPHPPRRRPPGEDIALIEEERRLDQLMREEEERLRWAAHLEMELGREEFQERERIDRGRRASPPRMIWGRDDGPWRGRGRGLPPPPGRGRRFERDFFEPEPRPPFPSRQPLTRPPPPRRMLGDREWDHWDDHRRDRQPMLRPRHDRPGHDWPPRVPPRGGSPERLLPPPEKPKPPADINQVNVNKLLNDLLFMGIIPGQAKPGDTEKTVETPVDIKTTPNTSESQQVESPVVSNHSQEPLSSSLPKNEKKLDENRVPTPVFGDLLTTDPNANMPSVELGDTDKLKIRNDDVVARLYTGIQCSACGMRFTACQTDMYAEHLDWHYRLNRKDKEGTRESHRALYPTAGEWIMFEEIPDPSQREKSQALDEEGEEAEEEPTNEMQDEDELVVPVAQNPEQDKCAVCNEAFTTVYNDEEEEWQYIRCVAVEGKNFHPACFADHNDPDDENVPPPPTPVRVPIYNPLSVAASGIPGLDSLKDSSKDNGLNEDIDMKNLDSEPEEPNTDAKSDPCLESIEAPTSDEMQIKSPESVVEATSIDLVDKQLDQENQTSIDSADHLEEADAVKNESEAQDSIEVKEIAEPDLCQDDSTTADNGTKSVDLPLTEIDKVDTQSPPINAVDNTSEMSSVSQICAAPSDHNDSVSLKIEDISATGDNSGENCSHDAENSSLGSGSDGCDTGVEQNSGEPLPVNGGGGDPAPIAEGPRDSAVTASVV